MTRLIDCTGPRRSRFDCALSILSVDGLGCFCDDGIISHPAVRLGDRLLISQYGLLYSNVAESGWWDKPVLWRANEQLRHTSAVLDLHYAIKITIARRVFISHRCDQFAALACCTSSLRSMGRATLRLQNYFSYIYNPLYTITHDLCRNILPLDDRPHQQHAQAVHQLPKLKHLSKSKTCVSTVHVNLSTFSVNKEQKMMSLRINQFSQSLLVPPQLPALFLLVLFRFHLRPALVIILVIHCSRHCTYGRYYTLLTSVFVAPRFQRGCRERRRSLLPCRHIRVGHNRAHRPVSS